MAFVGISQQLRNDVTHGIRRMMDAEVATLGNGDTPTLKGTEPWLIEKMWKGRQHLLPEIQDWCSRPSHIDLHVCFDWNNQGRAPSGKPTTHFRVASAGTQYVPPMYQSTYPDIYIGFTPEEQLPHELTTYAEFKSKKAEVEKRWRAVEQQVLNFLESNKSLNAALKLWPDLRMYIPATYMERVERKVERAEREKTALDALAQINTDELHAAVVIARMSGAQV